MRGYFEKKNLFLFDSGEENCQREPPGQIKRKESERELRPDSAKERERFTVPALASRFGRIKEKSPNANCVQTQSGLSDGT